LFFKFCISLFLICSLQVQAVEIKHDNGSLVIDKTQTRIIVLAFSFADALAISETHAIGIADDGNLDKLIPEVKDKIGTPLSVGSRYQPSLEAISSLKPDLIIADSGRHQSIYKDLKQIAPTLMFKSQGVTYQENIRITQSIGLALNKVDTVNSRLIKHFELMNNVKNNLKSQDTFQFAIVSDQGMWLHTPDSYAGSVIKELGLRSPIKSKENIAYMATGFEQFINLNPDWLFIGKYTNNTVLDKWKQSPLWKLLKVQQSERLITVSPNEWSLASGIISAENIALEIQNVIRK